MRMLLTLTGLAVLPTGCGPSDEQAARAIMLVSPGVFAIGLGLLAGLAWLWRKLDPGLRIEARPIWIGFAITLALAALSLLGVSQPEPTSTWETETGGIPGVLEWVPMALIVFGSSYLTLLLVGWRMWLLSAPASAFSWSYVPAMVILLGPCPIMAFGATHDWMAVTIFVWAFPGYWGLVTAPLLLALVAEVLVRIHHRKERTRRDTPTRPDPA
jgi:uncharacterized membrane protein